MQLGKVTWSVVATRKDPELVSLKLLVVRELDHEMKETGKMVVAVDSVQAGPGDVVLYASGSSARQTHLTKDRPVDATTMAIVDSFDIHGEIAYRKDE